MTLLLQFGVCEENNLKYFSRLSWREIRGTILLLSTENYSDCVRFVCGLGGEMFLRMWCVFIQGGEGHDESLLPSLSSILFRLSLHYLASTMYSFSWLSELLCLALVFSLHFSANFECFSFTSIVKTELGSCISYGVLTVFINSSI